MIKQMRFEFLKIGKRMSIWLLLFSFLIINCLHILDLDQYNMSEEWNKGYNEVYQKVKGEITEEKLNFIIKNYERNAELVGKGQYDPLKKDEGAYTGHIFGDMNLFKEFYDDLDYAYHYANAMESVISKTNENLVHFENVQSLSYHQKLLNIYKNRSITEYYETKGFKTWFSYDFSLLLSIIFIMFISATVVCSEKENEMVRIIHTTVHGRWRSLFCKFLTISVFILFTNFIFTLSDFIIFSGIYNLEGLHNPIFSIPIFMNAPLNITIFGYIMYSFFVKNLVILSISFLIIIISQLSKSSFISIILSVITIVVILMLQSTFPLLEYGLLPRVMLERFSIIIIGNMHVANYILIPILYTVFSLLMLGFSMLFSFLNYKVKINKEAKIYVRAS